MGLSATPNAAAKDLGAMLSAGNTAAADKAQGPSSGADTFGNLLSDRLQSDRTVQEAARRRADAQSAADDAASRRADIAREDADRASAARSGQDARSANATTNTNAPAQATTTSATGATGVGSTKSAQSDSKDGDAAAAQAAADPAAQLAAQIEAARQAAQQAAGAALPPAAQPAGQNADAAADGAVAASGKSGATGAATLAALNAAATGTQAATDPATTAPSGKDAKGAKASATGIANAPTQAATALPDGGTLAQTLARTRAVADNTPPTVHQLGSTSSAQSTGTEHGLGRRAEQDTHGNVTQTATTAVADATSHAGHGDHTGTQADAQGTGTPFQGALAHANGGANAGAPAFAVGTTGAAGAAAGASITPAQIHTLPTFGDAAWPNSMASQLAFMQVHRQSTAELQLSPAELGGLHVKLEVDNGAVNASFVCQHQAVAELVQDAMPRLRGAMEQGGLQLAQTSVSTGDFSQQQSAPQGSSAQGNGSGHGGSGGSRYGSGAQGRADASAVAVAPKRVSSHDGAIDTFA